MSEVWTARGHVPRCGPLLLVGTGTFLAWVAALRWTGWITAGISALLSVDVQNGAFLISILRRDPSNRR